MVTPYDVYVAFRRAQSIVKGRGYRLPKDWDSYWENKVKESTKQTLTKTAEYFNSIWENVDINKYMEAGFDVYKNFSYHQFLDTKVMEMYKRNMKNERMKEKWNSENMIKTAKFVASFMKGYSCDNPDKLKTYCRLRDDMMLVPVKHYLEGKVSSIFIVWALKNNYILLNDADRAYISDIVKDFREIMVEVRQISDQTLEKVKNIIQGEEDYEEL